VTLGGRYEWAERSSRQAEQRFELPTGVLITPAVDLETDFHEFLPKVAVDLDRGEQGLLYASAARGWLPGGFNLAAAAPDIAEGLVQFDSERLWSYEVGFKTRLVERRLRISGAAFWIEADTWQEFTIARTPSGAVASTTVVTSDSDVRSRGVEAEVAWSPSERLDLALGAAYTDSEYRRYPFGPEVDFSGNRPPFAPEFEVTARADWRFAERFAARASVAVQGDTALNPDNTVVQDTYVLLDVSLSYQRGPFTATLFADNVTDEAYFAGLAFDHFAFGADGVSYAPVGAPRAVGAELEWRW